MLELDCGLEFHPPQDEAFFSAIPAKSGVFLLDPLAAGAQPYVSRTADLRRAAERLLKQGDGSKRLNLREVIRGIRYRVTASRLEQSVAIYELARRYFPRRYRGFLRLRTPAMLKVNLRNDYPRCYVTRRLGSDRAFYFGPFMSRHAAQAFAEGFLDLFKIRRCQIKIRRDPAFPGCIYSEMKMCLAPCFAGCTQEEYSAEVDRVIDTLATGGQSLTRSLEQERDAASEALDFERAAALQKKLEKSTETVRGLPEIAHHIDSLDAVILQRSVSENTVLVFLIRAGIIASVFPLSFGELSSEPRSVEHILREQIGRPSDGMRQKSELQTEGNARQVPHEAGASTSDEPEPACDRARHTIHPTLIERSEHLSMIAKWFYSKPRQGEIFFRSGDWPYRRIIRACSRVLSPPKA